MGILCLCPKSMLPTLILETLTETPYFAHCVAVTFLRSEVDRSCIDDDAGRGSDCSTNTIHIGGGGTILCRIEGSTCAALLQAVVTLIKR